MSHDSRAFPIGGLLGIPGGANAASKIADLIAEFSVKGARIVATRDYHPHDHVSFVGQSTKSVFPPHCVQGSEGSKFYAPIKTALETARMKSSNAMKQVRPHDVICCLLRNSQRIAKYAMANMIIHRSPFSVL